MKVLVKKGFKNYERDGKKLSEKDSRKFVQSYTYITNLDEKTRPKSFNKAIREIEKLIPQKYQYDDFFVIVNDKIIRSSNIK